MPEWFLPLIYFLAAIVGAIIANIAVMCYWGGRMASRIQSAEADMKDLLEQIQYEKAARELSIKHECEQRERMTDKIWDSIDKLKDSIAALALKTSNDFKDLQG